MKSSNRFGFKVNIGGHCDFMGAVSKMYNLFKNKYYIQTKNDNTFLFGINQGIFKL